MAKGEKGILTNVYTKIYILKQIHGKHTIKQLSSSSIFSSEIGKWCPRNLPVVLAVDLAAGLTKAPARHPLLPQPCAARQGKSSPAPATGGPPGLAPAATFAAYVATLSTAPPGFGASHRPQHD